MNSNIIGVAGVLDVETTGFSPRTEQIIELGLLLFTFNRSTGQVQEIIEQYSGLREPQVPISKGASRVHGIYIEQVTGMKLDHQQINNMIKKAELIIAHNARFDYGFVVQLFNQVANIPWFCSMHGIKWKNKGFSSKALQNLLAAHGITTTRQHRAIDDALATFTLVTGQGNHANYLPELLNSNPINM